MTFIPMVNASRTTLQYTMEGQIMANVLWFQKASALTVTDLDNLNTALASLWSSTLKTVVGGNCGLTEVISADQTTPSSPVRTLIVSPIVYGTQAGGNLPANVSICISLRTALRGRSFRGRTYLTCRTVNDQAAPSLISSTSIANILSAWQTLLNTANTAGLVWSIVSHFANKTPRITGVSTPVQAISIDTPFDSMRRRLIGRGA